MAFSLDEERSASFVELFFDLVFVFGVTQIVASIHGHLDLPTLGRAAVILALMWWAWSQYTWLAGYTDFDDVRARIVLLVATAGSFVLATSVQGAWEDSGVVFAVSYFVVMAVAAVFMIFNAWVDEKEGTSVENEMAGAIAYVWRVMIGSALVLIGGFVAPDIRPWFWVAGAVVNFLSALAAGSYEYRVNASHFAERHGLFMIIVLGEVLIAIGIGLVGIEATTAFYVAGTALLVIALTMWWSYFDWLSHVGEHKLQAAAGQERTKLARDAYTFVHLPMVAGVILFAVGTEELLAHPGDVAPTEVRWAFLGGLILFIASQMVMIRRVTPNTPVERFVLIGSLAVAGAVLTGVTGATIVLVTALVFLVTLGVETYRYIEQLRSLRSARA